MMKTVEFLNVVVFLFLRKITSSFIYLPKNPFSQQISSLSEVPADEINYRAMS